MSDFLYPLTDGTSYDIDIPENSRSVVGGGAVPRGGAVQRRGGDGARAHALGRRRGGARAPALAAGAARRAARAAPLRAAGSQVLTPAFLVTTWIEYIEIRQVEVRDCGATYYYVTLASKTSK